MNTIFIFFLYFVQSVVLQETSDGKQCGLLTWGATMNPSTLPWHATIYSKETSPYRQTCGGTLISDKLVLSAAQCFWDHSTNSVKPASNTAVGLCKRYRPWQFPEDDHAQKSDVESIKIPPHFYGLATNFQADIAVLVLKVPATFNMFVRPVCLDFDVVFERSQLQNGKMGKTETWGDSSRLKPSQYIRTMDLPYIPIVQCISEAPPSFQQYITADKMCIKFSNDSFVCKGDSGTGLSFPNEENGQIHYYLRGIMSVVQTDYKEQSFCKIRGVGGLTQITKHEQFIKESIN